MYYTCLSKLLKTFQNSRNVSGSDHQNIVRKTTNIKSSNFSTNASRESNYMQVGPDRDPTRGPIVNSTSVNKQSHSQLKRSSSFSSSGIQKKHKIASWRDVTLADAAKYASLSDYGFFDKVFIAFCQLNV